MKGWKTVLFNVAAAVMPVLEASGADLGLTGNNATYYVLFVTVGNLILRAFTNTSVGQK